MTKNNKKAYKKLRQTVASIILSASCMTPVLATNEQKKKSSTSFWLRTGLELLLGAGCLGGVIREFQNRNTINSKDTTISELNQKIDEASKGLTEEQQIELTALKTLIETVYNGQEYTKYLKITDEHVEYKVDAILKLPEANTLKLEKEQFKPTNENGIVQTYMTTKQLQLPEYNYANVHTIPPYGLCLLTLADIELILKNNLVHKVTKSNLETKIEKLTNINEQRSQFIQKHVSLKSVVLQHIAIFVNTMFNNKFSESFHEKLTSCKAEQTIKELTAPQQINTYWRNCDLNMQNTVSRVQKLYLWEAILYMGFKTIVDHKAKTFSSKDIIGDFKSKFKDPNLTLNLLYGKLTPAYVSNTNVDDDSELKLALLALKFVNELANNLSMFDIGETNFSYVYWISSEFTNLGLQEMWEKYDTNVKQYKFEYNLLVEEK